MMRNVDHDHARQSSHKNKVTDTAWVGGTVTCDRGQMISQSGRNKPGYVPSVPMFRHQGIEWSNSTLALGLPKWSGKTVSDPAVAANNGNVSCNSTTGICVPATMMKPRPAGCGAAIAQGAISLGLDVVGAIPAFGNVVSATAAGARAVNGIVAYGGAAYGIATGLPDESPVGAAGAGAGLGLTLADTALEGGKVIPVLGNFLSAGIGLYDGYQLAKTIGKCW